MQELLVRPQELVLGNFCNSSLNPVYWKFLIGVGSQYMLQPFLLQLPAHRQCSEAWKHIGTTEPDLPVHTVKSSPQLCSAGLHVLCCSGC